MSFRDRSLSRRGSAVGLSRRVYCTPSARARTDGEVEAAAPSLVTVKG